MLEKTLDYDDLIQIRSKLVEVNPVFLNLDEITNSDWGEFGEKGLPRNNSELKSAINNFYMTDPISRSSSTMAKCMDMFSDSETSKTGTNG